MDAIATYDLQKKYDDNYAVRGISLQIPQGSICACIGGKKSGKTTLIRLLAGLCTPSSGESTVLGFSPRAEAAKLHSVIGVTLETARLYQRMTLLQNLAFFGGLHQTEDNDVVERSSFLLHKLGIWEERDCKAENLTTGALHRAALARALIHKPKVLLIDELTREHDRETLATYREMISFFVTEEEGTALICTEYPEYAADWCDSYAFLQEGALLAKGDFDFLRLGSGLKHRAVLRLSAEEQHVPVELRQGGEENCWEKEIVGPEEMPALVTNAVNGGAKIYGAEIVEPTLEEIYQVYLEGRNRKEAEVHEPETGDAEHRDSGAEQTQAGTGDGAEPKAEDNRATDEV